ncbi:MAG: hypothetical protein VX777_06935 [Chlamydiota bacterium]|nr:hypothetical protein [Chlamydiota bacterium]
MVLPIDPTNLPLDPGGHPQVCNDDTKGPPAGTLQSFPGQAPQETYAPVLFAPNEISIRSYSLIVNNSVNRLREMLFYGEIVDEIITKRFYGANVASARSPLRCSCEIVDRVFDAQISDPNYISFINDGLNSAVVDMTNAIETNILGAGNADIDLEVQNVNDLNQDIQTFAAIPNPTATDIANLNATITAFNAYAAARNADINAYNLAVDQYNLLVGEPTIGVGGAVTYPPGTINESIQIFNEKYKGTGVFAPLTFLPTLSQRDLLPSALPPADLNLAMTSQIDADLTIVVTGTLSPYNAFTALNDELTTTPLVAPTFGGNVLVNDGINYYNANIVLDPATGGVPVSPTEQEAISTLNAAIDAFNTPGNALFGDTAALNTAIADYQTAISVSPNLNSLITEFNEEIIGVVSSPTEGFNNTLGVGINDAIGEINALFPAELQYETVTLTERDLMPAAPVTASNIDQRVTYNTLDSFVALQIPDRSFHPLTLPDSVDITTIPASFDPILNPDGTISINQFPPVTNIPEIPAPVTPDPYGNINDYFDTLNTSIDNYNTNNVGTIISPAAGTENEAISTLNAAISTWNGITNPTAGDLATLEAAIDVYNTAVYGGSGFSATTPQAGSFNDYIINTLNPEVTDYNSSTAAPPAENLTNLNNEIAISNLSRAYYGLPLIPTYEEKPTRNLMPVAPSISSGANPADVSSFSLLSPRANYAEVPLMSETAVEADFIFTEAQSANCSVKGAVFVTNQQLEDVNFTNYRALLDGPTSIPTKYNDAISDYLSATAPDPGGMPAIAVSGPNVLLDPTTQQEVTQDLLDAINQVPALSQAALQQKIDEYNAYSALVNSVAVADVNTIINDLNLNDVGEFDINTETYPAGTLNFFAAAFNSEFGDAGLIGPLTVLPQFSPVTTMPTGLPAANTMVTIDGQSESFYGLSALLNATIQAVVPGGGNPSVNDINATIDDYNNQVGDTVAPVADSENGVIAALNDAANTTFSSDVSSVSAAVDPNVYFTGIDNLQNPGVTTYNGDSEILESGGLLNATTVTGIDPLDSALALFNANTLSLVNSSIAGMIGDINTALQPFSFIEIDVLESLVGRPSMPEVPDFKDPVPGQLENVSQDRLPYSNVEFLLELPSRLDATPTLLPEYFSLQGATSDLVDLRDNYHAPLIADIIEYNTTLTAQEGLAYENEVINELNQVILDFNNGLATPTEMKEAVSRYIQKISTDSPSVNGNIADLNAAISDYTDQVNQANESLSFWGLPEIPDGFNVSLRDPMPAPPLPNIAAGGTYALTDYVQGDIQILENRTAQDLLNAQDVVVEITQGSLIDQSAQQELNDRFSKFSEGAFNLKKYLDHIEALDEFQDFIRGRRREFANAYIERRRSPLYPSEVPEGTPSAIMGIGLTSHSFQKLLTSELFITVLARFIKIDSFGLTDLFQTLSFEIVNKATARAFTPSLLRLSGQIPFQSLRAFTEPEAEPIAPVVLLSFLEELRTISTLDVIEEQVSDILGGRAPQQLVDELTTIFNLSLLFNGLSEIGRVFGQGVPGAILRQIPALQDSGIIERIRGVVESGRVPTSQEAQPTAAPRLTLQRLNLERFGVIAGLNQLLHQGGVTVGRSTLDQTTSIFRTPKSFIDTFNFLVQRAGRREIIPLFQLARSNAAFTADQLPTEIIKKGIRKARRTAEGISRENLRNIITQEQEALLGRKLTSQESVSVDATALAIRNAIKEARTQSKILADSLAKDRIKASEVSGSLLKDQITRSSIEANRLARDINNDNILKAQINDDILKSDILRDAIITARENQIGTSLSSSELGKANALADDIVDSRIQSDLITKSVIQDDALKFRQISEDVTRSSIKEGIRNDIITSNSIQKAEINEDLIAGSIRDGIRESRQLTEDLIEAAQLADQVTATIIKNDQLMATINHNNIQSDLIQRGVIEDNALNQQINNANIVKLQNRFDELQREIVRDGRASGAEGRLASLQNALSSALQDIYEINRRGAEIVAQNAGIHIPGIHVSPLDIPGFDSSLTDVQFRALFFDKIRDQLRSLEENIRLDVESQLKKQILDGENSIRNLLNDHLSKLLDLRNEEINRSLTEEIRERFSGAEDPSVFLPKLQDPLYYGIYSVGAGIMYDEPHKNDYRRDIDIHV